MKVFLFFVSSFFLFPATGQHVQTQVVRGQVVDAFTHNTIPGALIEVLGTSKPMKTSSDIDGYFKLDSVPLGRQSIIVSSIGFLSQTKSNILVSQGKQTQLLFELEEEIFETEAVIINSHKEKGKALNENVSVSGRTFSIEETKRFAASKNDPARMAQNFAGVSTSADDRNDIIIRGNSPIGVQYKLDGIVIPNPNHFGTLGTTGGPVSILNNNNLSNSDFLTGAFPSEYGNALAGVFDLHLKTGNNEKREYLGQIGFNGIELGAEGPIKKESKSSYIANYRYSTLGIFQAMGINFGTAALPQYQDGTFKLNIKTKTAGTFSVFGMGGYSYINLLGSELNPEDLFGDRSEDVKFNSNMSTIGVNHLYFVNDNVSIKSFVALSQTNTKFSVEKLAYDSTGNILIGRLLDYYNRFTQTSYNIGTKLKKRYSAKSNLTIGLQSNIYNINFLDSSFIENPWQYRTLRDFNGTYSLNEAYAQFQFKPTNKITTNWGVHLQHLSTNNSIAIEPRFGANYKLNSDQTLSFGLGLHSQTQPSQIYFLESQNTLTNESIGKTNYNLDFTKSAHIVLGYDYTFAKNWRFKLETYYQYLYNVPIDYNDSTFSLLNVGADFGIPDVDSLKNDGFGRNYGLEFTIEKFFSKGYYILSTLSLYESNYKAADNIWRNTAFNGNFTFNSLAGKEFKIGKHNAFEIDIKYTYAGGRRYTPVDIQQSILSRETQYMKELSYSEKFTPYWRFDLRVGFRKEGKKITQEWSIDIQNITNRKNIFMQDFDPATGQIKTKYQIGLFPVAQYRITF